MKKIDGYRYVLYKNAQHKSWSYILIRLLPIWVISIVLIVMALQSCKSVEHRPRYNHWAKPYKMYEPVKQHKPNIK